MRILKNNHSQLIDKFNIHNTNANKKNSKIFQLKVLLASFPYLYRKICFSLLGTTIFRTYIKQYAWNPINTRQDTVCPNSVVPKDFIEFGENGGNSGFQGTQLKSAETVDYSGFSVDFKQCQSIFGNISRLEFNKICMPLISIVTVYNKQAAISSISNKRIKYTFISTAYNSLITLIIIMISTQEYHILQQFCSKVRKL